MESKESKESKESFTNSELIHFVKAVLTPVPKVHALLAEELRQQLALFVERVLHRLILICEICNTNTVTCNHVLAVLNRAPLRISRQFVLSHDILSEFLRSRLYILRPGLSISDQSVALLHQSIEKYFAEILDTGLQQMYSSRRKTLEPRDLPIYAVQLRDREFRFIRQFVSFQEVIMKMEPRLPSEVADQINNMINWVANELIHLAVQFKGRMPLAVRYLLPVNMSAHALQYRKLLWFHQKMFRKMDRVENLDEANTQVLIHILEFLSVEMVRLFSQHPVFAESLQRDDDFNELCTKLGVYAVT